MSENCFWVVSHGAAGNQKGLPTQMLPRHKKHRLPSSPLICKLGKVAQGGQGRCSLGVNQGEKPSPTPSPGDCNHSTPKSSWHKSGEPSTRHSGSLIQRVDVAEEREKASKRAPYGLCFTETLTGHSVWPKFTVNMLGNKESHMLFVRISRPYVHMPLWETIKIIVK